MYLSGPPLHPLAIALVAQFRSVFGDRLPVSFSGGIDEVNFADAVGLGLKPVTVCSDLLKFGGYRRGWRYFGELVRRMDAVGAKDIEVFTLKAHGTAEAALADLGLSEDRAAACRAALADGGDPRAAAGEAFSAWVSAARVRNSQVYAGRAIADPRYGAAENATPPKKIGSALVLFDCLTCDKCIPVCPNDANFSFSVPVGHTPVEKLTPKNGRWSLEVVGSVWVRKPRQIGAFADVCNECGHCDVLCPEDGGPYKTKPLFFGSRETFEAAPNRDGFVVERGAEGAAMIGRFGGDTVRVERMAERVRYSGEGFDLTLDPDDVAGTVHGDADGPVDLTRLRIMLPILDAVAAPGAVNYVSATLETRSL
jgi:putative selenate reductase